MSKSFSELVEAAERELSGDFSRVTSVEVSAGIGLAVLALTKAVQSVADVLDRRLDDLERRLDDLIRRMP